MKASPVQLMQLMFKHVRVDFDPEHQAPEVINPLTSVFTFDGVSLLSEVGIGEADMNHERGRLYIVELRAVVDNVPNPKATNQRFAPYKIDVAVEGLILIPNGAEKVADPEDLAAVNGASMLWGSIREQVTSITSRMRAGPVVMPSMNFHDLKKANGDQPPVAPAAQTAKTRRSNKA